MSDRIDSPSWPSPRGPWPAVTDTSRLYDHGQPWCVNAHAHPENNGGYPDRDRHLPWHECRTSEVYVDGVLRDLGGEALGVSVYAAVPFRFGQPRATVAESSPRIALETWQRGTDGPARRFSLDVAQALRLARILVRLADEMTFVKGLM